MLTLTHSNGMTQAMFGATNNEVATQAPSTTMEKIVDRLPPAEEVLPRVQRLLQETRDNIRKTRAAERNATLIGVGGGVLGVGIGAGVGRWAGAGNRIVTTVGAGAGAFGLGLLSFFLSRRIMMPPLSAGETAAAAAAAAGSVAIEATGAAAAAAANNEGGYGRHRGGLGYAYTS